MPRRSKESEFGFKVDKDSLHAYVPIRELVESPSFKKAMSLTVEQRQKIFEESFPGGASKESEEK